MSLISVRDYKDVAEKLLPKMFFDFQNSGAFTESTMKSNEEAFDKIYIRPRVLRDVSARSTSFEFMGNYLDMPIGIAPSATHKMSHPDGEIGTAKAAAKMNTIYIMGMVSTTSFEDLAIAAPDTHKWMQLYILKDRELTERAISIAESHGFEAIVLPVDLPVIGVRWTDTRNHFHFPPTINLPNFKKTSNSTDNVLTASRGELDDSITWEDVDQLIKSTKLPVILKGICTPEDAVLAAEAGCKGIIVSNHGGRHLDGTKAAIRLLPDIVKAVGDKIPVMIDGGITNGTSVFKALALGAKMVFVGRPILWGQTVNGQAGVENILEIYRNELEAVMALSGVKSIDEITKDYVSDEN